MSIPRYSVTVHLNPSVEVLVDLALSADDNDETSSIVHDGSFYAHPTDQNPETIYLDVSAASESEAERLAVDYFCYLFPALARFLKPKTRVVGILTDLGHYYESHEVFEDGAWTGVDCFDLTEDFAADHAKELPRRLEVDVLDYLGLDGIPVTSFILIGGET